jgi:hypothetical protein
MKIINIHQRIINASKAETWKLFETLSSDTDRVIATHKWPRMFMDNGLKVGSKGGHGPIGYTIQELKPTESIKFEFTKPEGFIGFHKFELTETASDKTELKHTIEMNTSFMAYIQWIIAIRWLHDAYIEDAFDKVESQLTKAEKVTHWNVWVKLLRRILRPKKRDVNKEKK